jgi:SecD/SecF fusion protein
MQNKGAITFLAIALALVCLYELSFTGASYKVKKEARIAAHGNLEIESNYIDSVASLPKDKWSFLGHTYKEVQSKEANLGLDLKGGMDVTLEISVDEILRAISNFSTDKTFNQAIAMAKQKQKTSQEDFLRLFVRSFEEIDPNARLASVFGTVELKDKINFNTTNAEVEKVLSKEIDAAIDNAFNILSNRIDRFGVIQPNISHLSQKGRILIGLPGVKDQKRVRALLQGTANLEFWETFENSEIIGYLSQVNNYLASIVPTATHAADTTKTATQGQQSLLEMVSKDSTSKEENSSLQEFTKKNPLFGYLRPNVDQNSGQPYAGDVVGYCYAKDTARVDRMLKMNQVKSLLPRELVLRWSQSPFEGDKTKTLYTLHALKITTRDGRAPLDGSAVTSARPSTGATGSDIKVDMSMTAEGSKKWAQITGDNVGRCVAVVLDNYVRSDPRVQQQISGGNTEISGHFTIEEATDLANILKSGKMPAPAHIVQDTVVGPSLGKAAIQHGMTSFICAFIVILLYMIFFYSRSAGSVADIALICNIFFLMGVMVSLNAVLTLPGIAGIVLTMGMAVDANVLIYERIKEELRGGKNVKAAIAAGYKMANSAIIDSNLTTLFAGIILFFFGSGPIKGFASTLVIGIVTSLFSAVLVSRLIYEWLLKKNLNLTFSAPYTANWLHNTKIDFISLRKYGYIFSGTLTIIALVSLGTKGLSKGIDFTGGRNYVINFEQSVSTQEIAKSLAADFGSDPMVVTFGADNQVKVSTKFKVDDPGAQNEVNHILYKDLNKFAVGHPDEETFISNNIKSAETVGPTIAKDISRKAIYAIILSLITMFFYIFLRFRDWRYGLGSIITLAHDVIIVLGIYSIFQGLLPFSMDIDQQFIAAILTLVGYSINDTVVIYDRIREYLPLYKKRPTHEVYNMALNSTLVRTLNTSATVLFVLIVIFLFGGEVIRGFIFALLFGVVFGTYSSIFISTPVLYETTKKQRDKNDAALLEAAKKK